MNLYLGTEQGLAVFEGQEETWAPRFVRLEDRHVTAMEVHEKTAWAGTTEGLFRSLDQGATWRRVRVGQNHCHVRAVAVRSGSPGTILVGTEPAFILISRDGGETWAEAPDVIRLRDELGWSLPYSPAAGCVRDFVWFGTRIYAAVEVGGVLRSDDSGASWRLVEGTMDADVHSVSGHARYPDVVHVATGGGRYRTRDGGKNWDLIGDGYTRAIWTDPERPEIVLAGPARYVGAMGRVERTIDGGESWMLASDGFRIPMGDMIERFVGAGPYVLALTSDGALYTAKRGVWMWHLLDLGLSPLSAVAFSDFQPS